MKQFYMYALVASVCFTASLFGHEPCSTTYNSELRLQAEQLFTDMRENIGLLPSVFAHTKRATQMELASIEKKALKMFALLDQDNTDPLTRNIVECVMRFYAGITANHFFYLKRHHACEVQRLIDKLSCAINRAHQHGLSDEYTRTLLDVNNRMRAFFNPQLYAKDKWYKHTGATIVQTGKSSPGLSIATVALGISSVVLLTLLLRKHHTP